MANSGLHLVVGGFPALATALGESGMFAGVVAVETTGQLREAIAGNRFPKDDKSKVVFLFADSLLVDTEQDLEYLIGGITRAGYKVIVMSVVGTAQQMVMRNPAAAIFDGTYAVNSLLGAISGLGVGVLPPIANGYTPIGETRDEAHVEESIEPFFDEAQAPSWQTAAPPKPVATGWQPAPVAEPPAQPQPQAQPRSSAPSGGWQSSGPAAQTPSWQQAPAPQPVVQEPPARPVRPLTPNPAQNGAGGWVQQNEPVVQQAPVQPIGRPMTRPSVPVSNEELMTPPVRGQETQIGREGFAVNGDQPRGLAPREGMARPGGRGLNAPSVGGYQDFAPSQQGRRRGWVITVTSPKGGTGKSSVAVNAAVYLGLHLRGTGQRVCLIDANFQQADTGKLLNQYQPNIGNILRDQAAIVPERIEEYLVERANWNTSFLLGPATPKDASPMHYNSQLYQRIVDVLRQRFDYIFIDTPVAEVYHDILRGFALPEADYILVPIVPAIHSLMNADAWLRTITLPRHSGGDGISAEKIGVLLNQAQEGVDCDEEQVRRELYGWNFVGAIPATKEWLRCVNNNEVIATKNYAEINESLSSLLYAATGVESLIHGLENEPASTGRASGGLLSRFRRGRK